MPKKKPPKNAFFFFMVDYKEKEEKNGKSIPGGLAKISGIAGRIWASMDENARAPYKQMEKEARGKSREDKLTSQGVPVKEIEKKMLEQNMQEREMKMHIQEMVQETVLSDTLATQTYYFISGNYFCKTNDGVYCPAEISLVEFSLKEGISNKFHSYVNPGNLPLGMTLTAKEYSESCHQLPIPPNAMGEIDFVRLLSEITKFLGAEGANELPPVFTSREIAPIVKSILSQFCLDANEDETLFRIYQLDELFFVLKKAAAKFGGHSEEGFPTMSIAQAALERDQYECQAGISCDFHENLDVGKYCSLSQVCRWSFIFADHICLDLAISLVPGHHVPKGTDVSVAKFITFEDKQENSDDDDYDDIDQYDKPKRSNNANLKTDSRAPDDLGDFCSINTGDDDDDDNGVWSAKRKRQDDSFERSPNKFGRGRGRYMAGTSRDVEKPGRCFGRGRLIDE